jgi:uncharacterized membrane protein
VSIRVLVNVGTMVAAAATPKAAHTTSFASHRSLILTVGLVLGVLIVILAVPLLLKKVRPNRVYGLTFVLSRESNRLWYAANQFLGACLLVAGLVTVAGTLVIWSGKSFNKSNKTLLIVELLLVVVPAALAYLIAAVRYRNR